MDIIIGLLIATALVLVMSISILLIRSTRKPSKYYCFEFRQAKPMKGYDLRRYYQKGHIRGWLRERYLKTRRKYSKRPTTVSTTFSASRESYNITRKQFPGHFI